jgi:hypothetical protein
MRNGKRSYFVTNGFLGLESFKKGINIYRICTISKKISLPLHYRI